MLSAGTVHVRGRGGGVETEVPFAGITTFRDGRVSRWEDFRERHRPSKPWGWGSRRCRRRTWRLAYRYGDALNARDVPDGLLAPGFVMVNADTAVTDGTFNGAEGVSGGRATFSIWSRRTRPSSSRRSWRTRMTSLSQRSASRA